MAVSRKLLEGEELITTTAPKCSGDVKNLYCQPCDRDGSVSGALGYCTNCFEHLCESCIKVHMKHKLLKDHFLLDKAEMPKTIQTSINSDTPHPFNLCTKHKREVIKFFCQDHKAAICSVCFTLEHQPSSCLVSYIPEISKDMIDGKEYYNVLRTIDEMSNKFHHLKENVNKVFVTSNDSFSTVLVDIQTFRKDLNERLDVLEKHIEDTTNAISEENSSKHEQIVTHCDDALQFLNNSADMIEKLNTSKQADRLFIEMNCLNVLLKDCEKQFYDLAKYNFKEYTFQKNETNSKMLSSEKSLGTVVDKPVHDTSSADVSRLKTRHFSFEGNICVETSQDKYICWITGISFLTPNSVILTDWNNKSLKMVDINSQSVTDQLILDERPWGITSINNSELAVTLLSKRAIQIISNSSNKLKIVGHTIKVDGECYGISCFEDKLVISFLYPHKVQILDMTGNVLSTLCNDSIVGNSWYILSNSSSIYISDSPKKTVTRLNWQGKVIGRYDNFGLPHGMSWSDDATLYVCDKDKSIIKEISEDCSDGKTILTDLKHPQAVCWCTETSLLIYSCHTGNGEHNNYLQIYKRSEAQHFV